MLSLRQITELRRKPFLVGGNRLQAAIDLAGETQTSVARALGLSIAYVSDTARGRYQTITVDNAHKFAAHFGCAIEDLFPANQAVA